MAGGQATTLRKVTLVPFQLKVASNGLITGTKASSQGPQSFCPAVFLIARADDANAASINWGAGNLASDPLAKGETAAFDLPLGYYFDASELCVSGTAADSIHFLIGVLESIAEV